MGQQQILLIVLSVILVGIAVAVGITMFKAQAEQSNVDGMIADLNNLGAIAYQYYIRPAAMGGGEGSYVGFNTYFGGLPTGTTENANGTYTCVAADVNAFGARIKAVSKQSDTTIRWILVDKDGKMSITIGATAPGLPTE